VQRDRLVPRPGRDLALGELRHQLGKALHPLAVERREHQPALLEVGGLVEQQDRVGAEDRFEDPRAFAGVEHVGRAAEQLLDLIGLRDQDERGRADDPQREALPVPRAALLDEGGGTAPEPQHLQGTRPARSGGQLHALSRDRSSCGALPDNQV